MATQMDNNWNITALTRPTEGQEVDGYSKKWVDEDFNPDGICHCVFFDDGKEGYFIVAVWCNECDEWHTRSSEQNGGIYKRHISAPTHWKLKSNPPKIV